MKFGVRALVLLLVSANSRCAAFVPSQTRNIQKSQRPISARRELLQTGSSRPSALHVGVAVTVPPEELQFESNENLIGELRQYSGGIQKSRNSRSAMKPIKSLKRFIDNSQANVANDELSEALSNALIRSFRSCGEEGDYRMISNLLQASIRFCHGQRLLSPRVFGEALDALSKTDSSVSKLKQIWKLSEQHGDILTQPMGAFELNVMLKALGSKKKVQAALTLYQGTTIKKDAFTASTLLNILTGSINKEQAVAKDWNQEDQSPCWQYQEGMKLLDDFDEINNFVVSSALKLNERASEVYYQAGRRHNGAQAALALLGYTKKRNIEPDMITCSHVMSCFDKQQEWKAAVAMLNAMESKATSDWKLPEPNEYAYSAAISACARANQYDEAIKLLERMRAGPLQPNTWVYNAVLSACVSRRKKNHNVRIQMALSLLEDMQHTGDNDDENLEHTAPDTVTYNTALAVMDGMGTVFRDEKGKRIFEFSEAQAWIPSETLVTEMLQEMRNKGVPRDALTYHNAIKASKTNSATIYQLLDEATGELSKQSGSALTGRAGDGLSFVYNAALASFAHRGDMDLMVRCFAQMRKVGVEPNHESVLQLVVALGRSRHSSNIMTLLQTLRGNQAASDRLHELFGIDLSIVMKRKSKELEQLYAVSISSCLVANDIESAMAALMLMKENGMAPSQSTMKEISFAYTRVAVEAASKQSAIRRKMHKHSNNGTVSDEAHQYARTQAERAGTIMRELQNPTPQLRSAVASAYAVTGSFEEARSILQSLHQDALTEQSNSKLLSRAAQEILDVLPRLHRSLLKICASFGDVITALSVVEDIQGFANDFSSDSKEACLADTPLVSDGTDPAECKNLVWFNRTHTDTARHCGMRGEDWKLFLIAASKSGDWKLCINTMQFLRPFLKSTHPKNTRQSNVDLSKKYRKLARALTASVLCFEERGQSAWSVRAIDDWIDWSGRRPPKEAVLAAIRILASQGRGTEVISLIQQCLQVSKSSSDSTVEAQHSYEEIVYIGAVTHLHNNGLYEDADEIYLQAITNKDLPFSVSAAGKHHILDLHGMNVAIANSAVRIALQQDILQSETSGDLVIVTGRGINSFYQMRPIIRPEIQRMLTEEFYPPLNTASIPGNMGALRVPAADIQAWATHQRQQKGVKLLALADALKSLSGGLLQRSMKLSLNLGRENVSDSKD